MIHYILVNPFALRTAVLLTTFSTGRKSADTSCRLGFLLLTRVLTVKQLLTLVLTRTYLFALVML